MYLNNFGKVVIAEVNTPQRGACVTAQIPDEKKAIFMDVRSDAIPDGQTGYLFGNKVIITVHWEGFNDEDMQNCFHNDLKLRIGCLETGIFMFCKFGSYPWGDVILLPGIISSWNDVTADFDEVIFVFVDSASAQVIGCRSFPISGPLATYIRDANYVSYEYFHKAGAAKQSYTSIDEIHDAWSNLTIKSQALLRTLDLEQISTAKGIYGLDADAADFAKFYKF